MAQHVRAETRDEVTGALISAATAAGDRVFRSRVINVATAEMPAILVYANEEIISRPNIRDTYARSVAIVIEGYEAQRDVADGTAVLLDEQLDALAVEIERAVDGWIHPPPGGAPNPSPKIVDGQLTRVGLSLNGQDKEACFGVGRLTYRIDYRTPHGDPVVSK